MAKARIDYTDESRSPFKTIVLLAWPVFLEQIFTTLVSYADTAMVGSLGAWATASVTISNSPIFLLNGVMMALGVGVTAMVAQATGAGDHEMVRKVIRHAILAIIFVGIPLCSVGVLLHRQLPIMMGAADDIIDTAATYNLIVNSARIFNLTAMMLNSAFRGYGDTKTPLYINTAMNVINVIGNYFLINHTREIEIFGRTIIMPGAGWEVAGAAAATAIGMFAAGTIALVVAFRRKNDFRISLRDSFKPDKTLVKNLLHISFPAMLERLFMSSSGIFVTRSIATLGTVNIAANSLGLTAESLSFMPAFAFQTAITTLVGQSLGAGKPELAEKFTRKTMQIGLIVMAFTGTGLYIFSRPLISIFTPDQEVIAIAAHVLKAVAFLQPLQVACWIFQGVLRGSGDTKVSFYITASTNWLIRTLWSVICIRVFGLGLFSTQIVCIIENIVRLTLLYIRYRSGKWKYMAKATVRQQQEV